MRVPRVRRLLGDCQIEQARPPTIRAYLHAISTHASHSHITLALIRLCWAAEHRPGIERLVACALRP